MAIGASLSGAGALDLALPNKADSFKFAVIGVSAPATDRRTRWLHKWRRFVRDFPSRELRSARIDRIWLYRVTSGTLSWLACRRLKLRPSHFRYLARALCGQQQRPKQDGDSMML